MHEYLSAIPAIISLIVIEGLLSVDNILIIAAIAGELPKEQQSKALKYGIVGAYLARGTCLFLAAWIANNHWVKLFGATYLIFLMTKHFCTSEKEKKPKSGGVRFWGAVCAIEFADLSLSLDNVVAAVALDRRLWVVCAGVFIGILALRFMANWCITLIERYPVLNHTAFLLVGFVGAILLIDLICEYNEVNFHVSSVQKFGGILAITLFSWIYGEITRPSRDDADSWRKWHADTGDYPE